MTSIDQKFFETNDGNVILNLKKQGVNENFINESKSFYTISSIKFVKAENLDEPSEDQDWEINDDNEEKELKKLADMYTKYGLIEITHEEYKRNEKIAKENNEKPYLSNFSIEEKFIYNKTKEFIDEYDLKTTEQISFLMSLRKLVVEKEDFSMFLLDDIASRKNKNIDDIFTSGHQSMIVDYFNGILAILNKETEKKEKPFKIK